MQICDYDEGKKKKKKIPVPNLDTACPAGIPCNNRSHLSPVIVSFDVPGQDFASKYLLIFKCLHAESSTVGMLLTGCDLENVPALHSFTNSKVILTPQISFIIETSSYLVRYIINTWF